MQHFVLKDINPEKVNSFDAFLKEMNDITVLITTAGGPHVSAKYLSELAEGKTAFELNENTFTARFKGTVVNNNVSSGYFELIDDGVRILEASYTISDVLPIALRVKLNCEGESLARNEFQTVFQRDFSHEAHADMKKSLEKLKSEKDAKLAELKEKVAQESQPEEQPKAEVNPVEFEENEELIESLKTEKTSDETPAKEAAAAEVITEEITEEIQEISEKMRQSLENSELLINYLTSLSHDLTRGAAPEFSIQMLKSERLENGAMVDMIDASKNEYQVTLRRGSLDDMVEVSFFLEKEQELIVSIYFSSQGHGRLATHNPNSHVVFHKIKYHLF